MTDTQNVPWKRLSVEAAAIVASILLAFSVDAWWQDRQIRIEEQQILLGLNEEFLSIHDVLMRHMAFHLRDVQSLEDVLIAIEDDPSKDVGALVELALLEMASPATTDIGNGTLDALLSSGRLEILTSRSLRAKLVAWERVISEVWDDQSNNAKMTFEIYLPYFVSENIPAGATMRLGDDDWSAPVKPITEDPEAIKRLLDDERFRVLAEIRYGFKRHLTGEFESAIAAVEVILTEIEKSMN